MTTDTQNHVTKADIAELKIAIIKLQMAIADNLSESINRVQKNLHDQQIENIGNFTEVHKRFIEHEIGVIKKLSDIEITLIKK